MREMTKHPLLVPTTSPRRRGTILVTTMAICFTLAMVVIVLVRSMAIEARASANVVAATQADAIERGAEQYVLALLNHNGAAVMDPATFSEDYFAGVPVGQAGWFFIMRPVYDDPNMPLFGLVDECSKLDINVDTQQGATRNAQVVFNQLLLLPGMTEEIAAAILDWQDADDDSYNGIGAENTVYTGMVPSYYCKNRPFDSVEELMMVSGMYHTYLWGDGTAGPLGLPYDQSFQVGSNIPGSADPAMARGWYDLVTVHAYSAPAAAGGGGGGGAAAPTVGRGLVNVNTAPPAVLYTLGLEDSDVQSLISTRNTSQAYGLTDTAWVADAGTAPPNNQITGESYRYSADILAVSGNGRAFKRVRIVVDASTLPVSIIWRRDVTDQGWPLDPRILEEIQAGLHAESLASGSIMGGVFR